MYIEKKKIYKKKIQPIEINKSKDNKNKDGLLYDRFVATDLNVYMIIPQGLACLV